MECDGALQGILSVCTFCGKDGQQPFDVHPHDSQLGHHWAWVGWCTGFIYIHPGIPERGGQQSSRHPQPSPHQS